MAICLFLSSYEAKAVVVPTPNQDAKVESIFDLDREDLLNLGQEELAREMGRPLTFKEKLALRPVKRRLAKNAELHGEAALEQVGTDGLAIAGFVTGVVSLFVFGIVLGILGIVFSSVALKRIKREPETRKGRGLAIAGLVTGIVGVVGWIILVAALSAA